MDSVNFATDFSIPNHDHSSWVIQKWYKSFLQTNRVFNGLKKGSAVLSFVISLLGRGKAMSSVDEAQSSFFTEQTLKGVSAILALLPPDAQSKERNSNVMLARKLIMGLMISLFPSDLLVPSTGATSPTTPSNNRLLQQKVKLVQFAATVLFKSFQRLLKTVVSSGHVRRHVFQRRLNEFQFSLRYFLDRFREWKAVDADIMRQSMEETYAQAYHMFLAAKVAHRRGAADAAVVHAAEEQTTRIREALRKLLGPQVAAGRLEEISAAVEAADPDFQTLNTDPQTQSTPATPTPGPLFDTASSSSALKRTLTPNPDAEELPPTAQQQAVPSTTVSGTGSDTTTSGTTSGTTSASAASAEEQQQTQRYLSLLSRLAGVENERMAHELTLDPHFRLPPPPHRRHTSSNTSSTTAGVREASTPITPTGLRLRDSASLAQVLRERMLAVLADALVNSLRPMPPATQILGNLGVGMRVPVYMPQQQVVLTAEILAVHPDPQTNTQNTDIQNNTDTQTQITQNNPDSVDVRYLADESVEQQVSVSRILSSSPSSSSVSVSASSPSVSVSASSSLPLLSALQDLLQSIAALIPQRTDLHAALAALFDPALLQQLIHANSLQPATDLLPQLTQVHSVLTELSAEYRAEKEQQWLAAFREAFLSTPAGDTPSSTTSNTTSNTTSPPSLNIPSSSYGINNNSNKVVTASDLHAQAMRRWFSFRTTTSSNTSSNTTSNTTSSSEVVFEEVQPAHMSAYEVQVSLLPVYLEHCAEAVEDVQRDLANHYLRQLVPVLRVHGASFLRQRFTARLMRGETSLDRTAQLLQTVLTPATPASASNTSSGVGLEATSAALMEAELLTAPLTLQQLCAPDPAPDSQTSQSQGPRLPSRAVQGVVAQALCVLLQQPIRLDRASDRMVQQLLPETLQWDGGRLARLRDLVDVVSLECSLVFAAKQLLVQRYRMSVRESEEVELQHRLDVLLQDALRQPDTASASASSTSSGASSEVASGVSLQNLVQEVVAYIQHAVRRSQNSSQGSSNSGSGSGNAEGAVSADASRALFTSSSSTASSSVSASVSANGIDTQELYAHAEKAVKDTILNPNAPVLKLFTQRIYKIVLRACLRLPYAHKLAAYSLQSRAQERNLSQLVDGAQRLCQHTLLVHGEVYESLLRVLAEKVLHFQQQQQQVQQVEQGNA